MLGRVAITGCSGYIGSVLAHRLGERGYKVAGLERPLRKSGPGPYILDYFTDPDKLADFMIVHSYSTLFHLAAKSVPINESMTHPLRYYSANPGLTARLLDRLIERNWQGRVIFASSASVYGESSIKVSESDKLDPISHYGKSKLMCEQILEAASVQGIKTVAFRFFNVAGSDNGWGDMNGHILTSIFSALNSDKEFVINGSDFYTFDGTCVRDYVHVNDICDAMISSAQRLEITADIGLRHAPYSVYNLGSGMGYSNLEIARKVEEITGKTLKLKFGAHRPGDVSYLVSKNQKFIQDYDFQYKHSDINNIIKTAWEHYAI